ncbi:YycH family regulatory protein [Ureibacillus aquaedulcis]|uniref:Two-component system activity regulator YycH n=1 Tax=Ureibacillus aquaedulcis TaxID=3058421 RepID=A0ABT8GRT5_9BACL|nr:two-component system activity regulator YycH [Ureibacillus sp. BA0131]MDN4494127.1 two-component system activity regulator YycH [Ureibacillus sp. BA0131]
MKHVEQIKSFVLFLLVILSLILTFSIWTYTPNYENIEDSTVQQEKLAEEKAIQEVLKPYRIVSHQNESFSGTVSTSAIKSVMDAFQGLNATEIMDRQNLSVEEMNSKIHSENQMTLFFSAEIPIDTFRSVLQFNQSDIDDFTFSNILIDWSSLKQNQVKTLELSFISKEQQKLYTTFVTISEEQFNSTFRKAIKKFIPYKEIERPNKYSLYVPSNRVDLEQYTYYIDEISTETFKNVLFKDINLVRKTFESNSYTDGMASMTSDSGTKTISYVYPPQSDRLIDVAELVQDSFDYINQHGGLTAEDYRYSYSNVGNRIVEYQLFKQGLPVFSDNTSTKIAVTWGENRVFKYTRPYYSLGTYVLSSNRQLASGPEIIATLENLDDIEELVLGYYLTPIPNEPKVYSLEPSWFVIQDGNPIPLSDKPVGGAQYGLE